MAQLSEQVSDLKTELAALRVQKVAQGSASKVAKMYIFIFVHLN
jgi:ribosomal protein L29